MWINIEAGTSLKDLGQGLAIYAGEDKERLRTLLEGSQRRLEEEEKIINQSLARRKL